VLSMHGPARTRRPRPESDTLWIPTRIPTRSGLSAAPPPMPRSDRFARARCRARQGRGCPRSAG